MVLKCCVPGCSGTNGHMFPKNPQIRHLWVSAVANPKLNLTKRTFVCYKHFQASDYPRTSKHTDMTYSRKILKSCAVPTIFYCADETSRRRKVPKSVRKKMASRKNLSLLFEDESNDSTAKQLMDDIDNIAGEITVKAEKPELEECLETAPSYNTVGIQCSIKPSPSVLSIERMMNDDKTLHYYTGLESYSKFQFVLTTLGPHRFNLKYCWGQEKALSLENQFLLTLIKLRRNTPHFELAYLFDISTTAVTNIFVTFINFMARQWSDLEIWPSRDLIECYMPHAFKESYPTTRIIIDDTEVPIEKPSELKDQQATFSTYKNRTTLKVSVGSSPGGLVTCTSHAFGGATSDRQIVERSKLPEIMKPGDSLLGDRGFNVQDNMFAYRDITVNIPTFSKGRNQLPHMLLLKDRKIANKRIHIERIIGMTKTYKILCQPLDESFIVLGGHIFYICCMLCNFCRNVVN